MKCNLIKKVDSKTINGKNKYYTHYSLVFENGLSVRVVAEYFPTTNIKDDVKLERIERANTRNVTLMDAFADLVKDE